MTLKFYTETHVARAITDQLKVNGVDVIRAEDVGLADASDEEHLAYATSQGRVIVTGDADFLVLDVQWRQVSRKHAGIIYILPEVRIKRRAAAGIVVKTLVFYHQAVAEGAATAEGDFYNRVIYITLAG
jgi:predicted nuclease of predicted toxin-antitoxin system